MFDVSGQYQKKRQAGKVVVSRERVKFSRLSVCAEQVSFLNDYLFDIRPVDQFLWVCESSAPPLWSSGQSSWLQIRRPGSIPGTTKKEVVGLERGPRSLVSTTEELLDRKAAAPV
jgi:hypothetical protein